MEVTVKFARARVSRHARDRPRHGRRREAGAPAVEDEGSAAAEGTPAGALGPRERRRFVETDIFQLEQVAAGNSIAGPAIVEHSATTFAIPPGRTARLDGITSSISPRARRSRPWRPSTRQRGSPRVGARLGRARAAGDARGVRAPVRRDRPLRRAARARADALGSDRLREAVLAAARRARLGALDRAEHLRLADRARARRAVLRAVHARGRLDRAVDRDHRARPHDVRRDQVDGPQRLRGEPRHPARRHLRQQRPDDRRRPQRRRADVRTDLLGGGAARVGGRRHARARHRREHARAACRSGRRRATKTASTCRA